MTAQIRRRQRLYCFLFGKARLLWWILLEAALAGFSDGFSFPAAQMPFKACLPMSHTRTTTKNMLRVRQKSFWHLFESSENIPDETTNGRIQDLKFLQRNKYWVVLVDDEQDIRMAVGDYLYDAGYQLSACADADAVLEICRKPRSERELPQVPDAIVSDIRMEGKNGLELLGLIRADERLKRVPVILLTAKAMTKDRIEGFRTGADAYLSKPFDPDELLAILDNRILRRSQMKGSEGKMMDLKQEMADIKQLMKLNGSNVVKKTDVFLTVAEREVLQLVCRGYTNTEIANERGISLPGVSKTMQKLYQETKTRTRTELVRWGIQTGYVPPK
jgi:DNA-binding NarL/FixJ family response regulator